MYMIPSATGHAFVAPGIPTRSQAYENESCMNLLFRMPRHKQAVSNSSIVNNTKRYSHVSLLGILIPQ
jgi:hypothetical protein